jgi:hypothetical protein
MDVNQQIKDSIIDLKFLKRKKKHIYTYASKAPWKPWSCRKERRRRSRSRFTQGYSAVPLRLTAYLLLPESTTEASPLQASSSPTQTSSSLMPEASPTQASTLPLPLPDNMRE